MLCYRSDKVMFALSELLDIPENYRPIVYPIAPISNDESDSSGTPKERVQAVAGNDPSTKVATVRPEPAKGLPTAEAIVQIAVETWYQNVIKISSGFYCVEVVLLIAENLEVARQIRTVLSELISRRDAALLEAHATALNESGDHGAASHLRAKFGKGSAR